MLQNRSISSSQKNFCDSDSCVLNDRRVDMTTVSEMYSGQKWLPLNHHPLTAKGQHSLLMVIMLPNQIIRCVSDGPTVFFLFAAARWGSLTDNWRLIHTVPCMSVMRRSSLPHSFRHILTAFHLFIVLFCFLSYGHLFFFCLLLNKPEHFFACLLSTQMCFYCLFWSFFLSTQIVSLSKSTNTTV